MARQIFCKSIFSRTLPSRQDASSRKTRSMRVFLLVVAVSCCCQLLLSATAREGLVANTVGVCPRCCVSASATSCPGKPLLSGDTATRRKRNPTPSVSGCNIRPWAVWVGAGDSGGVRGVRGNQGRRGVRGGRARGHDVLRSDACLRSGKLAAMPLFPRPGAIRGRSVAHWR